MDKFVTVTKPFVIGRAPSVREGKKHATAPYDINNRPKFRDLGRARRREDHEKFLTPLWKDGKKPSSTATTKYLLKTLSDESNPITHSDIQDRTDHITSSATGHQRAESRSSRAAYLKHRSVKLEVQMPEQSESQLLAGVRLYINGYLADTTDIELKRIVSLAGGKCLQTASGATHIVTSQQLNGSKTHSILNTRSKVKVHVVKPEWVTDSIKAGVRKAEREYSVIRQANTLETFIYP